MDEINFLNSEIEEDILDSASNNSSHKDQLMNKELILKLTEQKQILLNRIAHIDATLTLLRETPNYSKIHEMLNTTI